ncbi:hypothetical protein DRN97_10005 [Methanosarcinales archaeon]|nr:MAG: hypothetical protein DRN97_10005 [Methanosarcinales archaeon]
MYAEKVPKVEAKQNVRGVFEMLCAYDIHTHEVVHEFYDHKSHVEVANILTKLKQRNKHYRLYVMLDCWSAHITKELPELLNGQAIELVYLPTTNASWMNDVERVFADIEKNDVLANSNSPTTEHLQERISNYLEVEYPKKI